MLYCFCFESKFSVCFFWLDDYSLLASIAVRSSEQSNVLRAVFFYLGQVWVYESKLGNREQLMTVQNTSNGPSGGLSEGLTGLQPGAPIPKSVKRCNTWTMHNTYIYIYIYIYGKAPFLSFSQGPHTTLIHHWLGPFTQSLVVPPLAIIRKQ